MFITPNKKIHDNNVDHKDNKNIGSNIWPLETQSILLHKVRDKHWHQYKRWQCKISQEFIDGTLPDIKIDLQK